jgi:hypothetical protein
MDFSNSSSKRKFLTLSQAAQELGVSIDTLLQWNEFNILKPTITLSGDVGYTQEQIDKFSTIQQISRDNKMISEKDEISQQSEAIPVESSDDKETLRVHSQVNNLFVNNTRNIYAEPPQSLGASKKEDKKPFPFKLISYLSIIIILLIITATQLDKFKILLDRGQLISQGETDGGKKVLASQGNNSNSLESDFLSAQTKNGIFSGNNPGNEGINTLRDKFNADLTGKSATDAAASSNANRVPLIVSKLAENDEKSTPISSKKGIGSISYSEIANFSKNADKKDNLFDDGGNIKGETANSDVLGMAFKVVGTAQNDNSLRPVTDSNIMLTFLALGLIYVILMLRKQLMYSAKMSSSVVIPHNFLDNIENKKVLEVNQKTDGTVALYFQGREYKLCKPDLDSESDQFIEKLMKLAAPGVKEIDYDALNDGEINFNASLSKLVTRLGFVGIKRDLFFPRTSKNRVLFRRYITEQDLISMNLTSSDFKQIFE